MTEIREQCGVKREGEGEGCIKPIFEYARRKECNGVKIPEQVIHTRLICLRSKESKYV